MSTSHYSRIHTDTDIKPYAPSRHPSIQHSRPEAGDVGSETIRIPLPPKQPKPPLKRAWLLMTGILLLVSDGCGLAYFCDSFWESLIFCCLTMPTCGFVLWCAWEIYSLNDNEDWNY
jgi:hypothetical protein